MNINREKYLQFKKQMENQGKDDDIHILFMSYNFSSGEFKIKRQYFYKKRKSFFWW